MFSVRQELMDQWWICHTYAIIPECLLNITNQDMYDCMLCLCMNAYRLGLEASKLERKSIKFSTIRLQTMLNHRVNLFMRTGICKLKYKMCSDSILTWSMGSQHISEEMVSSKTEEMIPPAVEMVSLKTYIQVNKIVFDVLSFQFLQWCILHTFVLLTPDVTCCSWYISFVVCIHMYQEFYIIHCNSRS